MRNSSKIVVLIKANGGRIEVPLGTYFLLLGKPHQLEENEGKLLQLSDPRQALSTSQALAGRERTPAELRKTLKPERTSVSPLFSGRGMRAEG